MGQHDAAALGRLAGHTLCLHDTINESRTKDILYQTYIFAVEGNRNMGPRSWNVEITWSNYAHRRTSLSKIMFALFDDAT